MAKRVREARNDNKIDNGTCVICIGPVVESVELPCGHAYCRECLAELREKGVSLSCPSCRAELPPGLDGLYDLAVRSYSKVSQWSRLPPNDSPCF